MNVQALIAVLESKGLGASDILDVIKACAGTRSTNAERQARYRERKAQPEPPVQRAPSPPTAEHRLIAAGVSAALLAEWRAVRAKKRAGPITETIVDALERECAKASVTVVSAIKVCVERGWQSFRADFDHKLAPERTGPEPVFVPADSPAWSAWAKAVPGTKVLQTKCGFGNYFPSRMPQPERLI